jgi:hypothetical protein
VGSVAIEHWRVAVGDLTRVVQDDDLGQERLGRLRGVILGVTADVATADILDGDVLDVESNVVSGDSLGKLLVVHLNRLDLSGNTSRGEDDNHAGLQGSGLNTADGHRADTSDLVNVLQGQTQGLGGGARRGEDGVQGLEESLALGITALLAGNLPTLVPGELRKLLEQTLRSITI